MSTVGDKYLLGSGRSDHEGLRVISEIHDDRTRELLLWARIRSGTSFRGVWLWAGLRHPMGRK